MLELPGIKTKVVVDTNAFGGGLQHAAQLANGFKTNVNTKLGGIGVNAFGGLKMAAGGATGMAGQVVIGAMRKIGEEITAVVGEIAGRVSQTMESIDKSTKTAVQLGITTESFTAMAHAANLAGVGQAELGQTMRVMTNNIADAAVGAGQAAGALTEIGLSAKQLADLAPDKAFDLISDGMASLDNSGQRVRVMMNIFGKAAGPELYDLLSAGSKGMKEARDEAMALGLVLSDVDGQKVKQANDSLSKISDVIQGTLNKAVVALAPYLQGLADSFVDIAKQSGGFGQYAVAAVESVAQVIAYASDTLNIYKAEWYGVKAVVLFATAGVIKAIDLVGSGIVKLMNLVPGVKLAWTDMFEVMGDSVLVDAFESVDAASDSITNALEGKNQKAVAKFFDDAKAKSKSMAEESAKNSAKMGGAFKGLGDSAGEALKKIDDAMADLQKQIDQFGMSDVQKQVADFAALQGNTTAKIDAFRASAEKMRALKAGEFLKGMEDEINQFGMNEFDKQRAKINADKNLSDAEKQTGLGLVDQKQAQAAEKDWKDKINEFKKSIESPTEALHKQMDFLQDALATGDLNVNQFDAGAALARKTAFGEDKLPSLVRSGSAEALAAQFDAQRNADNSPVALAREQVKQQEKTVNRLDRLIRVVEDDTPVDMVF